MKRFITILVFALVVFPVISAQAASVTVTWGAGTETDLAGYKLYLMNQSNSADIKQLTDVKTPTTTATVTVTVTGAGNYVIVGTVYDSAGNESVKSTAAVDSNNQVAVFKDTTPPETMKMLKITSVSADTSAAAAAK